MPPWSNIPNEAPHEPTPRAHMELRRSLLSAHAI